MKVYRRITKISYLLSPILSLIAKKKKKEKKKWQNIPRKVGSQRFLIEFYIIAFPLQSF